jgi:hypothetical protein
MSTSVLGTKKEAWDPEIGSQASREERNAVLLKY